MGMKRLTAAMHHADYANYPRLNLCNPRNPRLFLRVPIREAHQGITLTCALAKKTKGQRKAGSSDPAFVRRAGVLAGFQIAAGKAVPVLP